MFKIKRFFSMLYNPLYQSIAYYDVDRIPVQYSIVYYQWKSIGVHHFLFSQRSAIHSGRRFDRRHLLHKNEQLVFLTFYHTASDIEGVFLILLVDESHRSFLQR